MLALVRSFHDLLLMRLPPQAFPASSALFLLTLAAFFVVAFLHHLVVGAGLPQALLRAIISVANVCAGSAVILYIAGRPARWLQTVTALFGGTALLGVMLLPVVGAWMMGMQNILIMISLLLFSVWELVFFAHVYRNALDVGMGAGLAVALIYLLSSMFLKEILVPLPGGAA